MLKEREGRRQRACFLIRPRVQEQKDIPPSLSIDSRSHTSSHTSSHTHAHAARCQRFKECTCCLSVGRVRFPGDIAPSAERATSAIPARGGGVDTLGPRETGAWDRGSTLS